MDDLQELYLDYVNNYLTVEKFAADRDFTVEQARHVIRNGRELHECRVNKKHLKECDDSGYCINCGNQ